MRYTCVLALFRFGIFVKRVPAEVVVAAGQLEVYPSEALGPVGVALAVTPAQIKKVDFNLVNSTVTFLPERDSQLKKMALIFAEIGFRTAAKHLATGGNEQTPGFDALKEWVVAHQIRSDEHRMHVRGRTKINRLV